MRAMKELERDRQIIRQLGGPTKVANMLGLTQHGPQQVANWLNRGIPAHIKVRHPELFMPELAERFGCRFPEPAGQRPA